MTNLFYCVNVNVSLAFEGLFPIASFLGLKSDPFLAPNVGLLGEITSYPTIVDVIFFSFISFFSSSILISFFFLFPFHFFNF